VAKLPPATPYRVYLTDFAINHVVDGRLYVIDGDALKLDGWSRPVSPDCPRSRPTARSCTWRPRITRGFRVASAPTLSTSTTRDASPGRRRSSFPRSMREALAYRGVIRPSADGRFVFRPERDPRLVGHHRRRQGTQVRGRGADAPAAGSFLPAASLAPRFSTLCGDGTRAHRHARSTRANRSRRRRATNSSTRTAIRCSSRRRASATATSSSRSRGWSTREPGRRAGNVRSALVAHRGTGCEGLASGRLPAARVARRFGADLCRDARQGQGRQPQGSRDADLGVRSGDQKRVARAAGGNNAIRDLP